MASSPPSTQITFTTVSPTGQNTGDLILESTNGAADPDTWVIINGVTYTFTFDVVGSFPVAGGQNAGKIPPALYGKQVAVITANGVNYFFVLDGSGTQALMDAVGNGNIRLGAPNTNPPPTPVCFCAGTEIATPSGMRCVEKLAAGEMVLNDRGEARQVLWVGRTRVTAAELRAHPELRPIRIPADAIAPGCPSRDLDVSPQHRVVLSGPRVELMFATLRVLVPAKHLVGTLAETLPPESDVDYYHVLLEDHEILVSNGTPTESFQPARRTIDVMSGAAQEQLLATLHVLGTESMLARQDSLRSLKSPEAVALLQDWSEGAGAGAPATDRQAGEGQPLAT